MARKVRVLLLCDMHCGEAEAQETISFAFGGSVFEIDLCASHAHDLRGVFETYMSRGRRVAEAGPSAHRVPGRKRGADIRRWARERGIQVGDHGRIPAKVMELYAAAHQPPPGGRGTRTTARSG
jgi:Lsr2